MRKIVLLLLLLGGVVACSPAAPAAPSAAQSAASASLPAAQPTLDTAAVPQKSPARSHTKIVQRYNGPAEIE